MKVLVVYESMYGNTHEVADHVAEGLRSSTDADGQPPRVRVLPVGDADAAALAGVDLLVLGAPTHAHALPRASTRHSAVEQGTAQGLPLEPDAETTGLREWFDTLPREHPRLAACFDTRFAAAPAVLTGRASRGLAHRLRGAGLALVADPESFLVDKVPRLLPGEAGRATAWGRTLAARSLTQVAVAGPART